MTLASDLRIRSLNQTGILKNNFIDLIFLVFTIYKHNVTSDEQMSQITLVSGQDRPLYK